MRIKYSPKGIYLFFIILFLLSSTGIVYAKDNNINKIGVYIFGTVEEKGRPHSNSEKIDYLAKEKNFIECYDYIESNITKYQKGMKVRYESNGKIVLTKDGHQDIYLRMYGGDNWATYLFMDTEDLDLVQIENKINSAQYDFDYLISEISRRCLKDKNYTLQKNMLLVNIHDFAGDFKLSCKPDKISYRLDCSDSVEYSNIAELVWDLDKQEHDIEESTYFLYQKRAPRTVILDRSARKDYLWGEGIWISRGSIFEDNFRCGLAKDLVEYPIEHILEIQSEKIKIQKINSKIKQKIEEKEELISDLSKINTEKEIIEYDYQRDIGMYIDLFNDKILKIKELKESRPRLWFSDFAIDYYKKDKEKLINEAENELEVLEWNFQQLKDRTDFSYTYSNQIESNIRSKNSTLSQIRMALLIFIIGTTIVMGFRLLEIRVEKDKKKFFNHFIIIGGGVAIIFMAFLIGIYTPVIWLRNLSLVIGCIISGLGTISFINETKEASDNEEAVYDEENGTEHSTPEKTDKKPKSIRKKAPKKKKPKRKK